MTIHVLQSCPYDVQMDVVFMFVSIRTFLMMSTKTSDLTLKTLTTAGFAQTDSRNACGHVFVVNVCKSCQVSCAASASPPHP